MADGELVGCVEAVVYGMSVAVLPVILVFLIFQKRFVQGMATSGIKG